MGAAVSEELAMRTNSMNTDGSQTDRAWAHTVSDPDLCSRCGQQKAQSPVLEGETAGAWWYARRHRTVAQSSSNR